MGQSGDRLIQSWGAPDRSETLSDGARVLTWVSVWADQQGQATCRKSFTLNKDGTVERWSFSGCPAFGLATMVVLHSSKKHDLWLAAQDEQ